MLNFDKLLDEAKTAAANIGYATPKLPTPAFLIIRKPYRFIALCSTLAKPKARGAAKVSKTTYDADPMLQWGGKWVVYRCDRMGKQGVEWILLGFLSHLEVLGTFHT